MSAKIIHVLCEGPTEIGFVDRVLKPYLLSYGVTAVKSVDVYTNKKLHASGGLVGYQYAQNDLRTMMLSNKDTEYERHLFTTMFDLYGLPNDFPGYERCCKIADRYVRVSAFEDAYSADVNDKRFIPYIQLHEYEAIVFCGLDYLKDLYPNCEKKCAPLKLCLSKIGNPELINDSPETAPSKRLINAIELGKKPIYRYNKQKTGHYIASKVGIDTLRKMCPHLNDWIQQLIDA